MNAEILDYDEKICDICNNKTICVSISNICNNVSVYCIDCLKTMLKNMHEQEYQDFLSLPDND
jgi:hypothetical protein